VLVALSAMQQAETTLLSDRLVVDEQAQQTFAKLFLKRLTSR